MRDSRWVKSEVGWWEADWLYVLSAEAQLAWHKLHHRAKSHGLGGRVPKSDPSVLARLWLQGEESVRQMLKAAELAGELIDDGDAWRIVKWGEVQGDSTGAERQARFRDRQKEPDSNGGNALRNDSNAEEKRREEKRVEEIEPPNPLGKGEVPRSRKLRTVFVPPSAQECADRAKEIGMPNTEARKFLDFYTSNGWKVGKNRMVDWHCAMSGWKSRMGEMSGTATRPKSLASHFERIQTEFKEIENNGLQR